MILIAFRHSDPRLFARAVCLLRGGDTAHCESAIPTGTLAWCVSSSFLDGGVRGKMIDLRDPAKWRVYRVPDGEHLSLDNWLDAHDMQGYDHLGLLGILWRPAGHSRSRKFCSEAVAEHLMLATPELYDPRTLEDLVERFFPRVAWSDGQWLPAVQLQQQPLDISGSDAETVPAS